MYKKSKYSIERTQEIRLEVLLTLNESKKPLSIEEIVLADGALVGVTSQKLSKTLGELCDFGFIRKAHSKERGKMVYGMPDVMEE